MQPALFNCSLSVRSKKYQTNEIFTNCILPYGSTISFGSGNRDQKLR